jgi:hypothetical protein
MLPNNKLNQTHDSKELASSGKLSPSLSSNFKPSKPRYTESSYSCQPVAHNSVIKVPTIFNYKENSQKDTNNSSTVA